MSVETFYNTKVNVLRLVKDTGESPEDTEEYQVCKDLEDIHCLIYPLDESYGQDLEGTYGKDSMMITAGNIVILEKDKIISQDGKEYVVVGVRGYSFMGTDLTEVRIREMPSAGEES